MSLSKKFLSQRFFLSIAQSDSGGRSDGTARPSGFSRRAALGFGLAGLGGVVLSGCGFHPMYGDPGSPGSAGAEVSAKLAAVKIEAIADRLGQELHNRLRDRMNPTGQPEKPNYRLSVTLAETNVVIASGDSHTRHNTLTLTATYWLSPADKDKTYLMSQTTSRVEVSYDTLDDPFNDISSQTDARTRGVDQLADMITTRVSAYFANNTA